MRSGADEQVNVRIIAQLQQVSRPRAGQLFGAINRQPRR
jgi:hypothetical protein